MAFDRLRYKRDAAIVGAAYVGATLGSRLIATHYDIDGALLAVLAGAPIVPAIASAFVFLRHFRTMDELQRRIHVEAFAAAGLVVGLSTFSLGFLEDVVAPRLSMIWVFPALILAWGAFAYMLRRKYLRE